MKRSKRPVIMILMLRSEKESEGKHEEERENRCFTSSSRKKKFILFCVELKGKKRTRENCILLRYQIKGII